MRMLILLIARNIWFPPFPILSEYEFIVNEVYLLFGVPHDRWLSPGSDQQSLKCFPSPFCFSSTIMVTVSPPVIDPNGTAVSGFPLWNPQWVPLTIELRPDFICGICCQISPQLTLLLLFIFNAIIYLFSLKIDVFKRFILIMVFPPPALPRSSPFLHPSKFTHFFSHSY